MNKSIYQIIYAQVILLLTVFTMIFYPMLISIYVFLPLLIGTMGYIFMRGLQEGKIIHIVIAIIYFINLEINLSLPLFLSIITALFVYVIFYRNITYFSSVSILKSILVVLLMDIFYLLFLLMYDFLFGTSSIVLDGILAYSFIVDMLVVVML